MWLMATIVLQAQSIVIDSRSPIQKQMNKENATYIITSSVNLNKSTVAVPKGCTIVMQGGQLSNGTLKGDDTKVENLTVEDVLFQGSYSNPQLLIDKGHFKGKVDLLGILSSFPKATITLGMELAVAGGGSQPLSSMNIDGKGHTIKISKFPLSRNIDVTIRNVVFDCSQAEDDFLYVINNATGRFEVRDCIFKNIRECTLLTARGFAETVIANNRFEGIVSSTSKRTRANSRVVFVYGAKGKVIVENNVIRNCFGMGISAIGFDEQMKDGVTIAGNTIENVTNGGIVVNGGDMWNATISQNSIANVHCMGSQFNEQTGAENSAINVHGFHNLTVSGNQIRNCTYGSCFDFDGTNGTDMIAKGHGLRVLDNDCQNVCGSALFGVQDVAFEHNTLVSVKDKNESLNFLAVSGSDNVTIRNNSIRTYAPKKGSLYPIYLTNTSILKSGNVLLDGNTIESEGNVFLFCNQAFTGVCSLRNNQNNSLNGKNKLTFANNAGEEHINLLDEDVVKSVSLKIKNNAPKLVSAKGDDRGRVKGIWFKASKDITLQEPATLSLVAKGRGETILWSSSYKNIKKGWTKVPLERYVQSIDSDYYITCSETKIKATLRFKVIMENSSAMKYF